VTNTATSTETSTSISTTTAPPSTVTTTSTVTQTTSSIPSWAYGLMVVLLLLGLAIGYVVKRPSIKQG
jgi:protein-S-isoprenylcysteine O-methyltransferase Ste14